MKKNNIPLNFREKINSRISLLCSAVILVLLVLVICQIDYTLISKPEKDAAKAAVLKEQQIKEAAETPEISTACSSSIRRLFRAAKISSPNLSSLLENCIFLSFFRVVLVPF